MITPPYLKAGDTVGIIAPARKITEKEIFDFLSLIRSWGLNYKTGRNLYGEYFQFSGTDSERAYDLQQMIDDPEVKAIFCARGGYGMIRILELVDFKGFKKSPKWIAGFSDVTVLHAYLNKSIKTESLHSIMPVNYIPGDTDYAVESLRKALFGENLSYNFKSNQNNISGVVKGELIGGNLSLLYSLNGTNMFPEMKNKILLIEDVDEYLYHIDRMIQNLAHSGVFKNISGLITGAFTKIKDNDIPFGSDVHEIILSAVEKFNFPVCFDFPAGHISNNMTLILGREIQLTVEKEKAEVLFSR